MNEAFSGYIPVNLHFPKVMNEGTGLMLALHGWDGDYHQYDKECEQWADLYNVITLQVDYRDSGDGSPVYDFGKYQAIDVLRAVDYVLKNFPVNRSRIIGFGGSGGGHVMLQAAKMAPNTFALVITGSAITKPSTQADLAGAYFGDHRGDGISWEEAALGAGLSYTIPEYQLRNPQYHAGMYNAKVILMHGDKDNVVSVRHAYDMYDALTSAGKEAELVIISGGDHSLKGALPDEDSRFESVNKYCAEDILGAHVPTDDFLLESKVLIPTDSVNYIVDFSGPVSIYIQ